jgi:hypothetical protein
MVATAVVNGSVSAGKIANPPQPLPGGEDRNEGKRAGAVSGGGPEFRSGVALGRRRAGEVLAAVTLERLVRRLAQLQAGLTEILGIAAELEGGRSRRCWEK